MNNLYVFLIRNDVWIYFVCALGIIWYLAEFWRGQRDLRRARFNLERERATQVRLSALAFLLIFAAIVGLVVYVNVSIRPTLPAELLRAPSPTPNPLPQIATTPTATAVVDSGPSFFLAPTVTLRPGSAPIPQAALGLSSAEPVPGVKPVSEGCTRNATITQPPTGSTVFGGLSAFGTADGPDFGAYQLEMRGPHTEQVWTALLAAPADQPVSNGFLGNANLGTWSTGIYELRLTVFDRNNAPIGVCTIQIGVRN